MTSRRTRQRGRASHTQSGQVYKVLLYFLIPAISGIAPFLVIPAITFRYGASGWASVAVATSLGAAGGVVAELGWGVVGPQQIARDPLAAKKIYDASFASKLVASAVVAPVAAVISVVIAPSHPVSALLVAVGAVFGVLSPAWYFIGEGRPVMVLITDTLPRVAIAIAAAGAISIGAPIEAYGVALVASALAVYVSAAVVGKLAWWPTRDAFRRSFRIIRHQLLVIVGRCVSTLYTSLPTALLGIVSPGSIAAFSALDRPMRMGLTVLSGVPNRLQSWIGTPDPAEAQRRSKISILINALIGLLAGLIYAGLAPLVVRYLFSGTIELGYPLAALEGLLAAVICASRGLGLALVAADCANSITTAIVISAVVGTVSLLALGLQFGVWGAVLGLVIAEVSGAVVQSMKLRSAWMAASRCGVSIDSA